MNMHNAPTRGTADCVHCASQMSRDDRCNKAVRTIIVSSTLTRNFRFARKLVVCSLLV